MIERLVDAPLVVGLVVGLVFGAANLVQTWLDPVQDDTVWAVLRFYGPMFFLWGLTSFRGVRRTGRCVAGVATGAIVAFSTFSVFEVFVLTRVNLFLYELTSRADWQNMMMRFRGSGSDNLRLFVNIDYLEGAPLKLAVSCAIGAAIGAIGGSIGWLRHRWKIRAA